MTRRSTLDLSTGGTKSNWTRLRFAPSRIPGQIHPRPVGVIARHVAIGLSRLPTCLEFAPLARVNLALVESL